MRSPRFRSPSAPSSFRSPILFACSLAALLALGAAVLQGQDGAPVGLLADVLAAEDARAFDEALLTGAARHAQPRVRRYAALAMGRIGDPLATPILIELLEDADSTVRPAAAFALGLLRDRTALPALRELVARPAAQHGAEQVEAVGALARIGGPEAATALEDLLTGWSGRPEAPPRSVERALVDAWRLGESAPVATLQGFALADAATLRWAAVHSLFRLAPPTAAAVLIGAARDVDPAVRAMALRALTRALVDSAGLDRAAVVTRIVQGTEDADWRVRVNALRTLATYRDSTLARVAAARADDRQPQVQMQALAALGDLGGAQALEPLLRYVAAGPEGLRRQALLSLARVAHDSALYAAARWVTRREWSPRAVGAEALGTIGGDTATAWLRDLLTDEDPRVAARTFESLERLDAAGLDSVARAMIDHGDPVIRTLAVRRIATAPRSADVEPLVRAYGVALDDSIADARVAIVQALAAVADLGFNERVAVEDGLLARYPVPRDYLVRRAAAEHFPAAAQRWGSVVPITTGTSPAEYREIVRRHVLGVGRRHPPRLILETERGRVEIELFPADAPLAVHAFLGLVEQRFFDGMTWHRVVPNFVIQSGDPRGDGWGGPGFVLRDENNLHRYRRGSVGIALSGPDTGGSQFFITMGPQPHLDGTYPVIGQVVSGMDVAERTTPGVRIRTVRVR